MPSTKIACDGDGCGRQREIYFVWNNIRDAAPGDRLRGVFICAGCGTKSPLELMEETITWKPGPHGFTELNAGIPKNVHGYFEEAMLCFYNGTPRACEAMARAMFEQALVEKGCTGETLKSKISFAAGTAKVLIQSDVTLAHGTRLVGNDAMHAASEPTMSEAGATLTVATAIVNRMYP